MLHFLGYGAIIWLGSKIVEGRMEAHYSAKTLAMKRGFSDHLSRLQQERKKRTLETVSNDTATSGRI